MTPKIYAKPPPMSIYNAVSGNAVVVSLQTDTTAQPIARYIKTSKRFVFWVTSGSPEFETETQTPMNADTHSMINKILAELE